MKRILLALLFIPALCNAQVAEVSLKGGIITNRISRNVYKQNPKRGWGGTTELVNPVGYAGSLAFTVGLPAGFRAGLAGSVYHDVRKEIRTTNIDANGNETPGNTSHTVYGQPIIAAEALLIKRFNVGRVRLDLGGSAGWLFNRKIIHYVENTSYFDNEYIDNDRWGTYGGLVGVQYRLGCRTAIGAEAQPRWMKMDGRRIFALPVMLKFSYSL